MTAPPGRLVRPEELQRLATLLQQSGAEVESLLAGVSMAPTLPPGAHIRIRCASLPVLHPGTVVAFVHDGRLMAHRLVRWWPQAGWALTRGDGYAVCDPPLPLAAIIGQVIAWRAAPELPWREVPAPAASGRPRRWVIALSEWATGAATAVHPGAARVVALAALRLRGLLLRARRHFE